MMKFKVAIAVSVVLVGSQLAMEPIKATPVPNAKSAPPLQPPAVVLGFAGIAQLDCVQQLEAGEYRCARYWAEVTHLLKSSVYRDVESQFPPHLQRQLAIADQSWAKFQTQHCQQMTQRLRNQPDFPLAMSVCLAKLNNDRILELQWGGQIITRQSRDPRFEFLLDQLKLRNSSVQRQWEDYRTQHCQVEKAIFPFNNLRLAECHQRLRQARLEQLEDFFAAPSRGLDLFRGDALPGIRELNCVDGTQIGLNRCAVYWSQMTQSLRSRILQDWLRRLSWQHGRAFKNAEMVWQDYHRAHCDELVEPVKEGSMAPMVYHRCLAKLNNDRIADLKGIATYEPDEDVRSQLTPQQDKIQQLWDRYQAEYCKFESQFFGNQMRTKQCPTRLSQARLRHLKEMMNVR